ncbi:MAG: ribose 5-phosphate isomerase B [Elusimicrobiota bacterium]
MKIALGADHGGFPLKKVLHPRLEQQGHTVVDCGTSSEEPVDYPDFSHAVAERVLSGEAERGIMICGSGVGACVAANKVPGIRAGISHDTFSARQGVEDDDVNLLCLGARVIGSGLAFEIVDAWLKARFSGAERHVRRRGKVLELEKRYGKSCGS